MLRWVRNIALGILALAVVSGVYIFATGQSLALLLAFTGPRGAFDASAQGPAPDYADAKTWAALPDTKDLADLTPQGIAPRAGEGSVDVFFVHPTGYIAAKRWTSPMDPGSSTEENTQWMLANQASAFNGCCDIYAPRYREAAIHVFFGDLARRNEVLGFAYQDVERAFDAFLATHSKGRPFILASHSQGSYHLMTLLEKRIDGTDLRGRMIAAYAIGVPDGPLTTGWAAKLKTIRPCDSATDLHCLVHFATYAETFKSPEAKPGADPMVCTNPLTWRNNGPRAEADQHKGAVPISGAFKIEPFGKDVAKGVVFGPLGAPLPAVTYAECRDGRLIVRNMSKGPLDPDLVAAGDNYHGFDYPLFYMDIRDNASARVEAYLAGQATVPAPVAP